MSSAQNSEPSQQPANLPDIPPDLEAIVRSRLAAGDRIRAIGECRTQLGCDFDTAHRIVRLVEESEESGEQLREDIKAAVAAMNSPSPPMSGTRHEFDCIIPNPGSLTTAESIGRFMQKDAVTRPARCSVTDSTLRISARDMYNKQVGLATIPTSSVRRITTRSVTVAEQAKSEIVSCAGYGTGIGVTIAVICFFKIMNQGNFHFGGFLILVVCAIAVCTIIGAIVGAVKAGAQSSQTTEHVEYELKIGEEDAVAFRVPAREQNSVNKLLESVGLSVTGNTASASEDVEH